MPANRGPLELLRLQFGQEVEVLEGVAERDGAELAQGHLRGPEVAGLDRAGEPAVCRALGCHRRWGRRSECTKNRRLVEGARDRAYAHGHAHSPQHPCVRCRHRHGHRYRARRRLTPGRLLEQGRRLLGQKVYVKPIGWTCTMATAGGEPTFFCRRRGAYVAINRNGVGVHTGSAPRAMGGGFYSFKIP